MIQNKARTIRSKSVGQTVIFGSYAQKPIEWTVIDKQESKIMLLSRHIIDAKVFYPDCIYTCWEKSSVRKWLNDTFYNHAFDEDERDLIANSKIYTPDCSGFEPCGANETTDKVFLLSADEVKKYLYGKDYLHSQPTQSALKNSKDLSDFASLLSLYDNMDNFWWWLRTPGSEPNNMGIVWSDGSISGEAHFVNFEHGIRPALNIKI